MTESTSNIHFSDRIRSKTIRVWAVFISVLAALPLLTLKAVFLSDIQGWMITLSYGLFIHALAFVCMGLIIYLVVEFILRGIYRRTVYRLPWFSVVAAFTLPAFIFAGALARPIVLYNPDWCSVHQISRWRTTPQGSFTLVTVGIGNLKNHKISSAYLNWLGEEPAGLSKVHFPSLKFEWWEKQRKITVDGTFDALYTRIAPSGLSEDQIDLLTKEIWDVLQQVRHAQPISAPTATIEPMVEAPFGHEDIYYGGIAWMATVTLLYLVAGQLTLFK